MDFGQTLKIGQLMAGFLKNHPKVAGFAEGVRREGIREGMEIAVAVRYPGGEEYKTGIRVRPEDLEILDELRKMSPRS